MFSKLFKSEAIAVKLCYSTKFLKSAHRILLISLTNSKLTYFHLKLNVANNTCVFMCSSAYYEATYKSTKMYNQVSII